MSVTAHVESFVVKAPMTRVSGVLGMNDSFGEEGQTLGGLECRSRRIGTHDGAVQQGLPRILHQLMMVLTTLLTHHHPRIEGRG